MIRVLILIKGLGRGGAEQLLVSAAPYLDRESFRYEVAYLLPWKNALVGELEALGLPVVCLEGGGPHDARWVPRLRRLVQQRRISIVHSHSPLAGVGARILKGHDLRVVHTEHNVWERYHPLTYWANLMTFARNDHVFAVSERVRSSIRYPRVFKSSRAPMVETLYHGLDPQAVSRWVGADSVREELGVRRDAPFVGTVANFKRHKGYEHLLRAAVLVREQFPQVRFVLVGRGPLEGEIRRLAHDLRLDDTVIFAGYREDAPRMAGAFDVFALSSVQEGLSIALIEAMAMGTPGVVSKVGGLPEVLQEGKQGFLVPPRDSQALAGGIIRLLRDEGLRERFGEEARRRAASFDIRHAVGRSEEVYRGLLR